MVHNYRAESFGRSTGLAENKKRICRRIFAYGMISALTKTRKAAPNTECLDGPMNYAEAVFMIRMDGATRRVLSDKRSNSDGMV